MTANPPATSIPLAAAVRLIHALAIYDSPGTEEMGRGFTATPFVLPWVAIGCASWSPAIESPSMPLADSFIFHPTRYPKGEWSPAGLEFEDAWFHSGGGTRLHGWYLRHEQPRAALLYLHGNAGNLSGRAQVVRRLHEQLGLSVFIIDYRGYGRSEGSPTVAGVLQDARAARDWLARREEIAPRDVVFMGRSLGGAVAVDLAASDGARALILESTFTSLADVAAVHFPLLPVRLVLRGQLESLVRITHYDGPLLQSHGDADRVVPYALGVRLHDAANEPKQFVTIDGADHNDPQTSQYYAALDQFLAGLP